MSARSIVFLALSALPLGAYAAGPVRMSATDIHSRYLQERAACVAQSGDERKTCLREAGAAQFEARRGKLAADDSADFEKNRLARCSYHKAADEREYCERRMHGEGTTTGSVEGGGILRELTVVVPAEDSGSAVH